MTSRGVIDLVREHPVPRPPVSWLSDEEKAVELRRVQQRRAQDAAYEPELILRLAGQTSWPGCSRPTAIAARSARCARACCRC